MKTPALALALGALLLALPAAAQKKPSARRKPAPATAPVKPAAATTATPAGATPASAVAPAPAPAPASAVAPAPAAAPGAQAGQAAPVADAFAGSGALRPGGIQARASLDTDILLVYLNLGAAADVGLLQAGPGTLAVGGGLDYGFCGSVCWAVSALTPINLGERYLSPHARLTYHFPVTGSDALAKLDLYGLLLAGVTWSSMNIASDEPIEGQVRSVDSSSVSFLGGLGAGANYFFSDRLFLGAEARLRYSQGTYTVSTNAIPGYVLTDSDSTWSLSGFNLAFHAGLRF
jgi:hypothetical protein